MPLSYGTYGEFIAIKRMGETVSIPAPTTAQVREYLDRGARIIDGDTRRRFYPFQENRRYSMPTRYVDLRQRAFSRDDLMLDRDLLEIQRVQVGLSGAEVGTLEVVPVSGLTARATTMTLADVDGLDEFGSTPRIQVGDILVIEQEYCPVTIVNTSTNVVTFQRGQFETLAAAHAAGVAISKLNLLTLAPGVDFVPLDFNIRPMIGLRVVYPTTWTGRYTGSSWRYRYPQIYVTGLWGYHEDPNAWWVDTLATVPAGGLTADGSSMTISASQRDDNGEVAWQDGFLYRIDDELIWGGVVTDGVTDSIALLRHRHGTTATVHAEGTPIYRFDVLSDVVEANLDIAKTLRDADASVGGRQGVSDMSVGVALGWGTDTTKTIKRLTRSVL